MQDFFGFGILLSAALSILSLIKPKWGLFFAVPEKQTRLRGFGFWWLVACLFFFLFGNVGENPAVQGFLVVAAFLCVGVGIGIWRLRTYPKSIAETSKKKQPDNAGPSEPQKGKSEEASFAPVKSREHGEAAYRHYEKISDRMGEDKYRAALNLIEETLADKDFDQSDDMYAEDAATCFTNLAEDTCFTNLAEDKSPQAVLNFYDKLKSEGKAIAYAERHGQVGEMSSALADSLGNYPEIKTKVALKKAVNFVMQDHPLLNDLRESGDNNDLHDFLDDAAENVFGDDVWLHGESDTLPELIAEIEAVAGGGKQREREFDPDGLTCTCAEWRGKRAAQPIDSPARLCRHLTRFFSENSKRIPETMRGYTPFIESRGAAGLDMPVSAGAAKVKYACLEGNPYIFEVKGDSPWVNVRLPGGTKYGFSVKEKRWARGEIPTGSALLEKEAIAFAGR